jgi:DNA-directed RNA polymerase subunit RPC12/RpoP
MGLITMSELNKIKEWKCTCLSCGKLYCTDTANGGKKCPDCGSGNVKTEEKVYYRNNKGELVPPEKVDELLSTKADMETQARKWKKDLFLGIALIIIGLPMLAVRFGIIFILIGLFIAISGLCERIGWRASQRK